MMLNKIKAVAATLLAIVTVALAAFCLAYSVTQYKYVLQIMLLYLYVTIKLSKICCVNAIEKLINEEIRRKKYEHFLVILCLCEAFMFVTLIVKGI